MTEEKDKQKLNISSTTMYFVLDSIVALCALGIVWRLVDGLIYRVIPQNNLPVLASLGASVLGLTAAYAGFRWGSSVGSKDAQNAAADAAKASTAVLATVVAQNAGNSPSGPENGPVEASLTGDVTLTPKPDAADAQ